jgi:putative N6-adenine-specific DNA methylase
MSSESPFIKRIKRHVIGRRREYFAVTAPGFEKLCLNELRSLALDNLAASAGSGGVAFKGRLQDCYLANLNLRTANRILMRIETVNAINFSQLQKKLSDISWELFLRAEQVPQMHVTTRHCRLYHTEAISERLLKAIAARGKNIEFMAPDEDLPFAPQNIYVRGVDDRFSVSIDSSGENLYKRGIKKHTGSAPLRETAAAAALMLAGYTGSEPLVDPMCGTGTFALEAALMAKNIPPGWFRDFAFMGWPSYQHKRWEYLKRQSEKHVVNLTKPMIRASDADPSAFLRLEECIAKFNLLDAVSIDHRNFFDLLPTELSIQMGFVAINPPYGRRIGSKRESEQLFKAICSRLNQYYKGWRLVLIMPHKKLAKHIPFKLSEYPLSHGGLKLRLMVGRIA